MRFVETFFAKEGRWWIGQETDSGRHYLGIPVSNRMVDYTEYYWLADEQYHRFAGDHELAFGFAEECRRREHDDLLVYQPGHDRGIPR
jgi:hypothetical protein